MALHPGERGVCPQHGHYDEFCGPCATARKWPHGLKRKRATDRQAMPTGEGEIVLGPVLAILDDLIKIREGGAKWEGDIQNALRKMRDDLEARAEMGKAKYGTYLRTHNGRNVRLDLYQEVLDAIMYSAQASLEDDREAGNFIYLLIDIARQLAPTLEG